MSFKTNNELLTFDFSQSSVEKITINNDHIVLQLMDVIILENNSCNEAFRKMATNDLTVEFVGVEEFSFIKDGYIIRDMDNKIREDVKDKVLEEPEWREVINSINQNPIEGIECKDGHYFIYLDTEESLISYTIKVKSKSDVEEWEKFRNLPDTYK